MPDRNISQANDWNSFLTKAVQDYHHFATQSTPLDAKEFSAYHSACKAALSHILILKKLIETSSDNAPEQDLFSLLDNARKATYDSNDTDDSFD